MDNNTPVRINFDIPEILCSLQVYMISQNRITMYHHMEIGLSGISLAEVIWVSGRMCDHVGSLFDSSSKFICHLVNTSLFTSSIQIYSYHCFLVDHLCLE
jgi:hypothetical protein